ncbi:hypothetical protein LguiA_003578 [Lonicera macranthoides]
MDDSNFPPNTVLDTPTDSIMDLDFMDELLLEGCWLEATDGSEFFNFTTPSTSNSLFDPSFSWPTFEPNNDESNENLPQKDSQEERQMSSFPDNLSISQSQNTQNSSKVHSIDESMVNADNYLVDGTELRRRWWIGPSGNHRPALSVMERLIQALGYVKDCKRDKDVLIQIWVPVDRGDRRVLSTSNQPFSLDINCPRLANYRKISVNYQFPAEEDSKEIVGMPGRVFMGKVPEWTPDVRFFRREEYPRVGHALQYDVRGTLAVPVFEQGSSNCLGVIEVVMTTQKVNYGQELELVCKALRAVDLRSSEMSSIPNDKFNDGSYQASLPEILELLRASCETFKLPLAQTWVPCIQQGKGGCRHSDENLGNCVSTVDSACYVADPSIMPFQEACSEHHLLKGQGVAGSAFVTNQPCFSPDVTSYSKTEYPLSHHARMFSLRAAVAIRLRSILATAADFVLEFFLPIDCTDSEEQRKMLTLLSVIIQKVCRSLRIVTEEELNEETVVSRENCTPQDRCLFEVPHSSGKARERENVVLLSRTGKSKEEVTGKGLEIRRGHRDSSSSGAVAFGGDCSGEGALLNAVKRGDKRRSKAEKTITLQMLRQYFAGSLKDAAKSIGVCPTTLKRICRQQGIKRWPSRKIKKVGHSLEKIQLVIDSVQGTSGDLQIKSFYSNFPNLASPNLSRTGPFSASKPTSDPKPLNTHPEGSTFSPPATAYQSLSASCSQGSSSSQCCSSGTQPHQAHATNAADPEDQAVRESPDNGMLKRATSDAGLHALNDRPKLLPRSQSHMSLIERPKCETRPPVPQRTKGNTRGEDGLRFKVTFGEERVRFRIRNNWGYRDLLREISNRFSMEDTSGFHLKYLDDDLEWVLLTCDADLDECVDVCRLSRTNTIKLSLLQDSQQHLGSSFGSSSPFG